MPPDRKNATSAPMPEPTSRSSVTGAPPHNRASATQGRGRVGAAAAEPGLHGDGLLDGDDRVARLAGTPQRRPQPRGRAPHEIRVVERHAGRAALQPRTGPGRSTAVSVSCSSMV